jgi:hypothetical protein
VLKAGSDHLPHPTFPERIAVRCGEVIRPTMPIGGARAMSEDKKLMFMPIDHQISDQDRETLRGVGYEVIQVTDPSKLIDGVNMPMAPMVLPYDQISRLMLRAIQKYKPARDDFAQALIAEMLKVQS